MSELVERWGKLVQLGVSTANMLMLAGGLLWAISVFWGDTKHDARYLDQRLSSIAVRVEALERVDQATIGTIRDGQEKTTNRLTTLETQNTFIMRSLDRLETAVKAIK